MKSIRFIARTLALGAGCTVMLAANPVAAESADRGVAGKKNNDIVVKCNKNNASVQKAIDKVKHGKSATIYIRGNCDESVLIESDDITLHGDRNGDGTIDGSLTEVVVDGARRVVIQSLEISGAGYGVLANNGAQVGVFDSHIHDNVADGVGAGNLSLVRAYRNVITGNGRQAPYYEAGIDAWVGSVVRSAGNLIADNNYAAVEVGSNSYFRSGFFTAGEPPAPEDLDVILQKGCSQGQAAGTCGDPGTVAVDFYRSGVADLRNADITGTSEISGLANFDVRTSTINGNVNGYGGSRIHLRDSVSGGGFVTCFSSSFSSSFTGCGETIPSP